MDEKQVGAFIRKLSDQGTDITGIERCGGYDASALGGSPLRRTEVEEYPTLWAALEALAAKMEAAS